VALLDAAGLQAAADEELVARVLPGVRLAGRGQRVEQGGVEWLLDVAHNPAAAMQVGKLLAAEPCEGSTIAVVGMLDDKDVEGIVAPLDERVDLWIAMAADSPRSIPAVELARRIANAANRPCLVAPSLADALQAAQHEASAGDRILVAGSFYVVGPALQALGIYSPPKS
jgi:dihydrofolate synthase/folylpolyglutamate synthase